MKKARAISNWATAIASFSTTVAVNNFEPENKMSNKNQEATSKNSNIGNQNGGRRKKQNASASSNDSKTTTDKNDERENEDKNTIIDFTGEKYKKIGNCGINGPLYEIQLLSLSFLKFSLNGKKFKLANNMKAADNFDDVVLYNVTDQNYRCVQIKHKTGEITEVELLNHGGDSLCAEQTATFF